MDKGNIERILHKELDATVVSTKTSMRVYQDTMGSSEAGMALQSCHKLWIKELGLSAPQQPDASEV